MGPLIDVAPLRNVQAAYFDLLRRFFGGPYEQMQKYNLDPASVAEDASSKTSLVEAVDREKDELIEAFVNFWEKSEEIVNSYLENAKIMKSFCGGDISPIVGLNDLSSTLLYTDTVILQCPVLKLIPLLQLGTPKEAVRLLIKHSLNVMRFEHLATCNLEPPVVVVTGSAYATEEVYRNKLEAVSEPYILAQAKALLGREFENSSELQVFISGVKTEDDAVRSISNPSRALFDTKWRGSLADQFHENLRRVTDSLNLPPKLSKAGFTLHNLLYGRMLQANDIVLLNSSLGATPLVSAPTSWQYLLWRYEFDAQAASAGADFEEVLITNAIITRRDRNEIPLLSGVSLKTIEALRLEGAMALLRETMRKSIQRVDAASRTDLKTISREVGRELSEAFDQHGRDLSEITTTKKRFYGVDVTSSIVTGFLTLAGAATGHIPLAVLGAVSTVLVGSKSVPALRETWVEMRAKEKQVKRSPTAILLRTSN